jgi:hypothetical protein
MSKLQCRSCTLASTVALITCLTGWLLFAAGPSGAPYLNLDFETTTEADVPIGVALSFFPHVASRDVQRIP